MLITRRYLTLALLPALVVVLGLVMFPSLYMFNLSFRDYFLTNPNAGRPWVGLENYRRLFTDSRFHDAALRTGIYTTISVGVSMVAGIALGKFISLGFRGGNTLRTLLIVPLVTTPLVVGAAFRFMLDADFGVINYYLGVVGLPELQWLSDPMLALPMTALVDAWQWTPFVALIVAAGIETLPPEPFEAARIDRASRWQEMRYLTIPMLRPLLTIAFLIRFMDAFREFDKIFILTAGGPGTSSETLPIYLWRFSFSYFEMGFAAAAGVTMLIAITLVSSVIVSRSNVLEGT